jgi:hypothetical protein
MHVHWRRGRLLKSGSRQLESGWPAASESAYRVGYAYRYDAHAATATVARALLTFTRPSRVRADSHTSPLALPASAPFAARGAGDCISGAPNVAKIRRNEFLSKYEAATPSPAREANPIYACTLLHGLHRPNKPTARDDQRLLRAGARSQPSYIGGAHRQRARRSRSCPGNSARLSQPSIAFGCKAKSRLG